MSIELSKEDRQQALDSLQQYFVQNMDEPIGNMVADALLAFMLEEVGPLIYNQGVRDAQTRIQERVAEVEYEVHEDPFLYWRKSGNTSRSKK